MNESSPKILIIDDDPSFQKILSDTFSDNGFQVVKANDGIEGIKVYLENRPEIVICDLVMPRMGGVSTCMEITRLGRENPPLVVLLTSMFKEPPHEHEAPEMGAKVHIPKSTKPLDIVILIEQLLAREAYPQV